MNFPEPEWLLDCEPRPVQLEALRRSYYGHRLYDRRPDDGPPEAPARLRDGPAVGWGHWLQMRLGKTPTALNEFLLFRKYHGFEALVVLSPNSYKQDWFNEANLFGLGVPMFAYRTSYSSQAEKFLSEQKGAFAVVLNYEALQYDNTHDFLKKVMHKRKVMLVADESIKLKNPTSLQTRFALELAKKASVLRTLSGLPFTQGPQDLYGQLRFMRYQEGVNYFAFRNRFCKMGGFKNKRVVGIREENKEALEEIKDSVSFIAKRKDWGRSTQPEYYEIPLELSPVQKKHYVEMDQEFITWLENGTMVTVDQVVSKMLKLQQISSGFLYLPDKTHEILMPMRETPKMKRLLEMMETEVDGKVVVNYHYGFSGDALLECLAPYNPAVIRGGEWMRKNRKDAVSEKKRFNGSRDCRVMVLQTSAGKYGHDLTGRPDDRTATMFFYENTYSYDDRQQIEARVQTSFQDWTNVYFDFASSKVERDMIKAILFKADLVEAVFGSYGIDRTPRIVL